MLSSGSLYPAAALAIVLPIFLPVAVAVVAGVSIAGEASSGTLRYLLARPVGRTRLLAAKLIALIVYTLSAVILVAVTAYLTGIALFGSQPVLATPGGLTTSDIAATSLSGSGLTPADIALRTIGAIAFIAVSMLGVGAIALFLSTITDSALGAALGALAALITSEVLVSLNAASAVNPYLPTRYWLAWIDFFRDPIVWRNIERGFAVQAAYVVVLRRVLGALRHEGHHQLTLGCPAESSRAQPKAASTHTRFRPDSRPGRGDGRRRPAARQGRGGRTRARPPRSRSSPGWSSHRRPGWRYGISSPAAAP